MFVGVVVNAFVKSLVSEMTRDLYRGTKRLVANRKESKANKVEGA